MMGARRSRASLGLATPAIPALLVLLVACGSSRSAEHSRVREAAAAPAAPGPRRAAVVPAPQALVTDETQNRLLLVSLPSGRVAQRTVLPPDPEDIAASPHGGVVVVVSSRAGKVTVLDRRTMRPLKTFGGFDLPHIAAISPDGDHVYITDDARGTLTVIRLSELRVTSTVRVGAGAHHLTSRPDQRRLWVALGESAKRIVILDTSRADHPRVLGAFGLTFAAHDLSFSPDGRRVWITSSTSSEVTVLDAKTRRVAFRVGVGPAPQHIAFDGHTAYLTSGYGSRIESVNAATGAVIRTTSSPYGSFELAAADGYVAAASLLRGTLAIYTPSLRLLRVVALAPATREVAISRP
jgi:YVTN family beta-propeller protein